MLRELGSWPLFIVAVGLFYIVLFPKTNQLVTLLLGLTLVVAGFILIRRKK